MISQFWSGVVIGCLASAVFWLIVLARILGKSFEALSDLAREAKELQKEAEKLH